MKESQKIRSRRETNESENLEKTNTLEIANATRFEEIATRIPFMPREIPFGGLIHPINVQQQQLLSKPGSALCRTTTRGFYSATCITKYVCTNCNSINRC